MVIVYDYAVSLLTSLISTSLMSHDNDALSRSDCMASVDIMINV
jgi:hypothetical protein